MSRPACTRSRRERGTTLLEALIAFGVLSLGILTIGRVQAHLRLGSDIARQRSEAVRLGQQDLEMLRGYSVIGASAGARSYAEIETAAATIDGASGYATNTRYRLSRDVQPDSSANAKLASVSVGWTDRSGADRHVVLNSIIGGHDPLYSAALSLAPAGTPVKGAYGRSASIPLAAKDLGDGRSVFKPVGTGTTVLVFDNTSGLVSARCTLSDPALATRDIGSAALLVCDNLAGHLLSGTVRFSSASPAGAAPAADVPLPFAISVALAGGTYPAPPTCSSEALKTVSYASGAALRVAAVPVAATPATLGLATWVDSGDRYAAYHCVVYPLASGRWSGRSTLIPSGWTIGSGPADRRVCRYSSDLDGSGAVDSNIEHPSDYEAVSGSLAHQNFVVIGALQACPAGAPPRVDAAGGGAYADLATRDHQP